ncbi:transcriptional regulator [Jeongeupia naejangsanensis]
MFASVSAAGACPGLRTVNLHSKEKGLTTTCLRFGSFVFQPGLRYLIRQQGGGEPVRVRLAGAEAAILARLLECPDVVCSKEELVGIGWDGRPVSANSLPVAIGNLRRHLHVAPYEVEIRNLPRQGYLLTLAVPLQCDLPDRADIAEPSGPTVEKIPTADLPAAIAEPIPLPAGTASKWQRRLVLANIVIGSGALMLVLISAHEWIPIHCSQDGQGTICAVADPRVSDAEVPAQRQGKLVLMSGQVVQTVEPEAQVQP